jgi:hypothetical protein
VLVVVHGKHSVIQSKPLEADCIFLDGVLSSAFFATAAGFVHSYSIKRFLSQGQLQNVGFQCVCEASWSVKTELEQCFESMVQVLIVDLHCPIFLSPLCQQMALRSGNTGYKPPFVRLAGEFNTSTVKGNVEVGQTQSGGSEDCLRLHEVAVGDKNHSANI